MTSCYVLLNTASGSVQALGLDPDTLGERLAAHGVAAEIVCPGRDGSFADLLSGAKTTEADILVAAGGDGTVTALAGAALDAGKVLAILPLGTANLLARDLGLPLTLDAWIAAFADMVPRRMDAASVNGHLFLHKVVLGLLPGIASARERLRNRGNPLSLIAFARFIKRRIERLKRMRLTVALDSQPQRKHALSAIAVANNAYTEGIGQVFHRDRLDSGRLSVYFARRITVTDTLRLIFGMALGNWHSADSFTTELAETVEIDRGKKRVKAMIDGDPITLDNPLRFAIRPGALSVLAPKPETGDGSGVLTRLKGS